VDLSFQCFCFRRRTISRQLYFRRCLINNVNGFIRKKPVIDITNGHFYSRLKGLIQNLYIMMFFIIWAQPLQDFNSLLFCRLFHDDRLKTPFKRCILFNVFPIFFQCRCSDQLDLSTGKRRFQDIGSIQCTFRSTGSDDRMDLINKEQYSLLFAYLIDHISDTFFKLTAIFTSCYHSGKIQNYHTFIFYSIRYHSCDDPLCKSLYDSRFSYSRLSSQAGIVLCSSAQDLDQSGNLFIPSHYRIQLTFFCHGRQISAILIQSWCYTAVSSL